MVHRRPATHSITKRTSYSPGRSFERISSGRSRSGRMSPFSCLSSCSENTAPRPMKSRFRWACRSSTIRWQTIILDLTRLRRHRAKSRRVEKSPSSTRSKFVWSIPTTAQTASISTTNFYTYPASMCVITSAFSWVVSGRKSTCASKPTRRRRAKIHSGSTSSSRFRSRPSTSMNIAMSASNLRRTSGSISSSGVWDMSPARCLDG